MQEDYLDPSVLGTVLLIFFRNRKPKTLLIWTAIAPFTFYKLQR